MLPGWTPLYLIFQMLNCLFWAVTLVIIAISSAYLGFLEHHEVTVSAGKLHIHEMTAIVLYDKDCCQVLMRSTTPQRDRRRHLATDMPLQWEFPTVGLMCIGIQYMLSEELTQSYAASHFFLTNVEGEDLVSSTYSHLLF